MAETLNYQNFVKEIAATISKYGYDAVFNTPDFILAGYILDCLMAYNSMRQRNDSWNGIDEEV